MAPTVYLFDVDGTLVDTGGAGRRSMNQAFERVMGFEDALAGMNLGGMTDWKICRQVLQRFRHRYEALQVERVLDVYLQALDQEIGASSGYQVLPGVFQLLEYLESQVDAALGLGTGNIEAGARIKLRRGDLDRRFEFGGFGSDAEDRAALLHAGAERGARKLNIPLPSCRVVVIGDTPLDIAAAEAIGAECVAVATGSYSKDALASASYVFGTLQEALRASRLWVDAAHSPN
ncbi:MAG: HAD family hydrolase [Myxococcota bacterium]